MKPRRYMQAVSAMGIAFLLIFGSATSASAQHVYDEREFGIPASANDPFEDRGRKFIMPDAQPSSDPAAAVAASADVGGTGGGLAVTGSDIEPVLAASLGLMAVGGSLLVSSRRRVRDLRS